MIEVAGSDNSSARYSRIAVAYASFCSTTMEGYGLKYVFGRQLKGWLRQRMGVLQGWQRRFFVLDSGRLSCMTREDDVLAIKTYTLKDCQLKEFPKSSDCSFELVSGGESVTLRAASEEERKEWVKALRYIIYGDTGGGVFGVPLEDLMKYEYKEGRTVPYIVEACVQHLELNAKETEGIFRLPGRANLVKELRGKFEAGYRPVLDNVDVHTVASLFKAYLRDLPESLVPPSFYQRAMNFALRYADNKTEEFQRKELTGLSEYLKELPGPCYATLAYICRFLKNLSACSEKTKMDSHNLSLVFGPNLIRHLDDNPQLMMVTTDLTQQLAYMLIHHCDLVFPQGTEGGGGDEDSPVLRNKASDVPTADLLNMYDSGQSGSDRAIRPTALCDLMGVDFTGQEEDQSSPAPESPFVVIGDKLDSLTLGTSDKREDASAGTGSMESDLASGSGLGAKPIPPKRKKAKTLRRNQKFPESTGSESSIKDSPSSENGGSFGSVQSLTDYKAEESSSRYNVEVGMSTALDSSTICDMRAKHGSASLTEDAAIKHPEHSVNNTGTDHVVANTASDQPSGAGAVTLRPSRTKLESEVLALKAELVSLKSQYDRQVTSLKRQLNSTRSSYEEKLAEMEQEFSTQMKDLKTRLAVENKARSEAVDQTVSLQSQLYQYKLQYGEIKD